MAYDKEIEARIKKVISPWKDRDEKKMFGGVCHLLNGKMFCGIYKNLLILRLGEEHSKDALKLPFVRPFDITGKPMKGWVMVGKEGFKGDHALRAWLNQARKYVRTL